MGFQSGKKKKKTHHLQWQNLITCVGRGEVMAVLFVRSRERKETGHSEPGQGGGGGGEWGGGGAGGFLAETVLHRSAHQGLSELGKRRSHCVCTLQGAVLLLRRESGAGTGSCTDAPLTCKTKPPSAGPSFHPQLKNLCLPSVRSRRVSCQSRSAVGSGFSHAS